MLCLRCPWGRRLRWSLLQLWWVWLQQSLCIACPQSYTAVVKLRGPLKDCSRLPRGWVRSNSRLCLDLSRAFGLVAYTWTWRLNLDLLLIFGIVAYRSSSSGCDCRPSRNHPSGKPGCSCGAHLLITSCKCQSDTESEIDSQDHAEFMTESVGSFFKFNSIVAFFGFKSAVPFFV